MRKNHRNAGFSLGELLVVVAILVILMGLAFVALFQHQRTLTQLELDGAAKEIFVAAQNHLTLADSQGLLDGKDPGTKENPASKDEIYYFVVGDEGDTISSSNVLGLMLPFASVDETVRSGSYVIRYDKSGARVLEVFYAQPGSGRYNHKFSKDEYSNLEDKYSGPDKKSDRQQYSYETTVANKVVGWYSGDELGLGEAMGKPTIQVINAERLLVKITNPNTKSAYPHLDLTMIVTDEEGGKEVSFPLVEDGSVPAKYLNYSLSSDNSTFTVVLDDITVKGERFADHQEFKDKNYLPGENLLIYVKASNHSELARPMQSLTKKTNSLFADWEETKEGANTTRTAYITNIRHLENLGTNVSGYKGIRFSEGTDFLKAEAKQLNDLSWKDFCNKINSAHLSDVSIYDATNNEYTEKECYLPVNPDYPITYDGKHNSILDLKVDYKHGPAGMFGTLIDNSTIQNVAVRNTAGNDSGLLIKGTGDTGGLVGVMNGGTIEQCAAAVRVESTGGNAGGLVGSATNSATKEASIRNSYSGGHTYNGTYYDAADQPIYNVKSTATNANAGGLVGSFTGNRIESCYSTCSVSGTTAGGLVGTSSGHITNCYNTGLIGGTDNDAVLGAFAGSFAGTATGCYYLENINSVTEGNLPPVSGTQPVSGIEAVDKDTTTYQGFFNQSPRNAIPYDNTLTKNYGGKYPLKTVSQLADDSSITGLITTTHYGDWPKPAWEVFFVNEPA